MTTPPPPPPLPTPQQYRVIAYPNYFVGAIAHGDPITIHTTAGQTIAAALMDLSAFGLSAWYQDKMHHIRWERIERLEWEPQP